MIKRPQKAPSKSITNEELEKLTYPVLGSFKLDGFRCVTDNAAYTNSMKLIKNKHIQSILSLPEYASLDGELIVGAPNDPNAFNNTTGPLRRFEGEPNFKFYVFDIHSWNAPYKERYKALKNCPTFTNIVEVVEQYELNSPQEVIAFEAWCVEQGYEGAMIRNPNALYKEGRCTLKEQNIFKRKPLLDDEAVIVGFSEQMENQNEEFTNELGNSTRSSHQENKVGKGTLGSFTLRSKLWEETFDCGTGLGLTDALRQEIWNNRDAYIGKTVVYKYQAHGSLDKPRQPIFKGFRAEEDLSED